jgi:D-glycero-D-manno-heptose 1,7-bisphosphate phosphatase
MSASRFRSSDVVFLDKDGTLITNVPYSVNCELITLAPGAADALRTFAGAGLDVAVVSNQPGVAFGRFAEDALDAVRDRLAEMIAPLGVRLRAFYYCPHHPAGTVSRYAVECQCRKPQCGLLLRASAELDVDLARSWMVGDILDDVEAGRRAGCRTALVNNGGETEWVQGPLRQPDVVARDLAAAARAIVGWSEPARSDALFTPNAERM